MACGLSRNELVSSKIALNDEQRCGAILPGGGGKVCNSLLSEHSSRERELKSDAEEEEEDTGGSSYCGRFGKRFVHSALCIVVVLLLIWCIMLTVITGIYYEVPTSAVSNLKLDSKFDAVKFWFRTNRVGMMVVDYGGDEDDEYREINEMYDYSSFSVFKYKCNLDEACDNTTDNLSNVWRSLILSTSVSAAVCVISMLLASPRNLYPLLHNSSFYKRGLREKSPALLWFLKPVTLTYLLQCSYATVFIVQLIAYFNYINVLPSNEDMYKFSLHYLNNDPSLCSPSAPCDYSFESVDYFERLTAFFIVLVAFAALAVVLVGVAHRLKLRSTRWECFNVGCMRNSASSDRQASPTLTPVSINELPEDMQLEKQSATYSAIVPSVPYAQQHVIVESEMQLSSLSGTDNVKSNC